MDKDNHSIEQLVKRLGLKRAVELTSVEGSSQSNQSNDSPLDRGISHTETTSSSLLLQQLREKLKGTFPRTKPDDSQPSDSKHTHIIPQGTLIGDEYSQCLYYHESFPPSYCYGEVILSHALHFTTRVAQISTVRNDISEFSPQQAILIDTETTSLFGGTGTVAFLIGIGFFRNQTFHIEQFFMRDYDDEPAVLSALNERLSHFSFLVGYNSKCFDFPLLRNRFRLNRITFLGETIQHLDLMHIARRFWGKRLSDCSLGTVERFILKERRYSDIPGEYIPGLWLEYVRTRTEQWIPKILEHNKRDILALVGLMAWLAPRVQVPYAQGFEEHYDQCALFRLMIRSKRYEEAVETAPHLLQTVAHPYLRSEIWKLFTQALKKLERVEDRLIALQRWSQEDPNDITPLVELAKYYEHQEKNIPTALSLIEKALELEPANQNLLYRQKRLLRKKRLQDTHNEPP